MTVDPSSEPETRDQKPETYFGDFTTHSPEETLALARRIGEQLRGGEIFLLRGDLGAGKTVFAKGIASGLGIDPSDVTSPTFTLINVHEGRLRLYHIDLYRLEAGAHQGLGIEEIFGDDKGVTVIEWAERLTLVPLGSTEIEITYASESERTIAISRVNHRGE